MQTNIENWLQNQNLINKSELARAAELAPGDRAAISKLNMHLSGKKKNNRVAEKIRAKLLELKQELEQLLEQETTQTSLYLVTLTGFRNHTHSQATASYHIVAETEEEAITDAICRVELYWTQVTSRQAQRLGPVPDTRTGPALAN